MLIIVLIIISFSVLMGGKILTAPKPTNIYLKR